MVITEPEPGYPDIRISGEGLSLEVATIMVKFLNDCLEEIRKETKLH
jgi:hypothetical protein